MLTSFFFFFKSILRSNWNRILFLKQKKLSILKSNLKLKIVPFLKSIYFLKFIFKKQKKIHSLESEWSPLQICSLWNINLKFVFIPKSSKIKSHWNSIISVFFCVLLNSKLKAASQYCTKPTWYTYVFHLTTGFLNPHSLSLCVTKYKISSVANKVEKS